MTVIHEEDHYRVSVPDSGKGGFLYECREKRGDEWRRADHQERQEFFREFAETELRSLAKRVA